MVRRIRSVRTAQFGRKIRAQFSDAAAALCSFHVLLNLAEEPEIEKKMAKRGIVGYLCKMLARSNTELLVLALIFLKKLAIFKENLPEMRREKLVAALVGFVPHHTEAVLVSALRLLYNLSFDAHQRDAIIASPLLTKAVGLVRKRMQLPIVLRLAYNLSSTEKGRKALGATDLPAIVRKHVLACAAAAVPALCLQPAWAAGRSRTLVAACAAAAPLGYALASHVDADMRSLGADVAALDGARYKHKDV